MTAKLSLLQPLHEYHRAAFDQLDGWIVPRSYRTPAEERETCLERAGLVDLSAWGRITVEGRGAGAAAAHVFGIDAGGLRVGAGAITGGTGVYRLREDRFFLLIQPEQDHTLPAALPGAPLPAGERITVTDMSHGWGEIGLLGPRSPELLSRLCGLNLDETGFPNLSAGLTSVAKTTQLVIRHDLGELRFYSLIGDRSLGPYLWKTALRAGRDLEVLPVGLKTLQMLAVRHPVFRMDSI